MDVKRLARFHAPWPRGQPLTATTAIAKRAGNTCTSSSTTTRALPTSSAMPVRTPRPTPPPSERAIAWFASLGLGPPEAVMTDNAMVYRHSRRFAELLHRHGARHILTPPYTPRWNGKAERFIQTLQREWAYAHQWQSSAERPALLAILPSLLQPASPAQLTGRPAADQPRSQRLWVGQLEQLLDDEGAACRAGSRPRPARRPWRPCSALPIGDSAERRPAARSASVEPTRVQVLTCASLLVEHLGGSAEGEAVGGSVGLDDDRLRRRSRRRLIRVSRCAWSSLAMWYSAFSLRSPSSRATLIRAAISIGLAFELLDLLAQGRDPRPR